MSKERYNQLSKNGTAVIDHCIALSNGTKIGSMDALYANPFSSYLPLNQKTAEVLNNAFTYIVSKLAIRNFKMKDLHNGKTSAPLSEGNNTLF